MLGTRKVASGFNVVGAGNVKERFGDIKGLSDPKPDVACTRILSMR
jgi:hypothetical protein